MKIRILRYHDPFNPHNRHQLDGAAISMSERTSFQIRPTVDGFAVSGVWQGKFLSEKDLVDRISRDLQLASVVIFDSTVEG